MKKPTTKSFRVALEMSCHEDTPYCRKRLLDELKRVAAARGGKISKAKFSCQRELRMTRLIVEATETPAKN